MQRKPAGGVCPAAEASAKLSADVMLVHIKAPVVKVPVLSNATVRQVARASSTRPPLINMPLQWETAEFWGTP